MLRWDNARITKHLVHFSIHMSSIKLSLLGGFRVSIAGEKIAFPTVKVRALLAYLILEADRAHDRNKLANLLWPEVPERQANYSFRTTLYRLRSALTNPP